MIDASADDLDFGRGSVSERVIEPVGCPESPPGPDRRPQLAVAGERVISPVSGRLGAGKGGKLLALLGLVAGCGVFLAATWTHPKPHKAQAGPDEPIKQVVDFASVKAAAAGAVQGGGILKRVGAEVTPSAAAPTLAAPGAAAPSLTPDGPTVPAIALNGATGGGGATAAAQASGGATSAADAKAAAAREAAAQAAARLHTLRSAPLLVFSAGGSPAGVGAGLLLPTSPRGGEATVGASELDQLRRGSTIGLVHATRLPDRNFLLSAGAVLPCVLETALDSSAPGFVTCRVPKDVYSDNGGVVLLEKGSRVIGEYRSGFSQGRARIFVLWDRITTTGGVAVDVGSPAADALGRAGFDGRIDSHFWQRFGGALLLTTVQGGLSAAATADARFASVGQAPNEAAAVALQNSVNIPPTLTKPQGSEVAIFVSRDLDFSSVYSLKGR